MPVAATSTTDFTPRLEQVLESDDPISLAALTAGLPSTDLKQRILDALYEIEPKAGRPVSAKRLSQRRLLRGFQKADLDLAALGVRSDRRVWIERPADPHYPTAENLEKLFEENGIHYVAASLRTA